MKKLIVFFLILSFTVLGYAQGQDEQGASAIEELTATVSTDPGELQTEAKRLGIPQSQVKRYVVYMRNINQEYQNGSMTRTEYIAAKRQVIQNLQ